MEAARVTGVRTMPGPREIHLWTAPVNADHGYLYEGILSKAESRKVRRYRSETDRVEYLHSHIVLRRLIASYTGMNPGEIEIVSGAGLKPELHGMIEEPLRFNISSSRGLAVLAFSTSGEVGVDVEFIDREEYLMTGTMNILSDREAERIGGLPLDSQVKAFFDAWTAKEAFLKGTGDGLIMPLDSFEIIYESHRKGRPVPVRRLEGLSAGGWRVFSFEPGPCHSAAVAFQGDRSVSLFEYQGG